MILMPDLFSFAYVPNWYSQLDMLAEMDIWKLIRTKILNRHFYIIG